MKEWFLFINFYRHNIVAKYLQLITRLINTSGVYLRLHLGDPAFIRSPALNRVITEQICCKSVARRTQEFVASEYSRCYRNRKAPFVMLLSTVSFFYFVMF